MIDNKPNIFEFATKELSQDAVFCYILDCFHATGKRLIAEKFLEMIDVPGIDRILRLDIKQQQDNIDIKAILYYEDGSKKYIIIEDKVRSSIHNNQLMRYRDETLEREKCCTEDIIGVFFKHGEPLPWEIASCEAAGFTVLKYTRFLDFLKAVKEKDPILDAFTVFFEKRMAYYRKVDTCAFETLDQSEFEEMISIRYGQRKLTEWIMKRIFTKDYRIEKMYDVNNFGSPCTQYEFIFDHETKISDWGLPEVDLLRSSYCCFFRIDRNAKGWYVAIRQYFRQGANDEEAAGASRKRNELLELLGEDNAPNRKAKKEKTLLLYNIDSVNKIEQILPKLREATAYLINTLERTN